MRQHEFETYGDYLKAQRKITLWKVERPKGYTPFIAPRVASAIADYHPSPIRRGLCHGVRRGEELDLFKNACGGEWIGTEIVQELCDGERIIQHDFHHVRESWQGQFDVVYSNSLDHAHDPAGAVTVWLGQLSPTGLVYVEWTPWSNKLGKGRNKADCYADTSEGYMKLLSSVGVVRDVIPVKDRVRRRKITREIYVIQ